MVLNRDCILLLVLAIQNTISTQHFAKRKFDFLVKANLTCVNPMKSPIIRVIKFNVIISSLRWLDYVIAWNYFDFMNLPFTMQRAEINC